MTNFMNSLTENTVFVIFLALSLGYLFERISFGGLKFGTSGVLIMALILGHFGLEVPKIVGGIGLVLFLSCVGLSAGPVFISNLKTNIIAFLVTSATVVISAGIVIIMATKFIGIPRDLALGISAGALTCTASLASTIEATGSTIASVGYGLAYVSGIVGIVMFVQIIPKLLKVNIEEENKKLQIPEESQRLKEMDHLKVIKIDGPGIFVLCLAITLGVILGSIEIPIGRGAVFSLGNSGGSLIAGLLIAHFGHLGKISFQAPKTTLISMRDFVISLFLLQNGATAGQGFVDTLAQYGVKLFVTGLLMTAVAIIFAFFISYVIFKMPLFAALGATTGAMTSAPALNALIAVSGEDQVAAFYAACQPVATVGLVLLPQIILSILK
ncbi:MAG: antiporter [Tissierellia bacterium]|nr:antiporter [Tissierellia bacterium]